MKTFISLAIPILLSVAMTNTAAAAAAAAADQAPPKKIAILLFDDVEIIDYSGPYEVFGAIDDFDVYTVSATGDAVTTAMGMRVLPQYSFANAPQADVLIVPGGGVQAVQHDAPTLEWIKKQSGTAAHVMSVCNGAFTLANTGLLQGLTATTTRGHIGALKHQHPELKVVRDQRVVDNGKFVVTGGLSAGIDGALHILTKMRGEGEARAVAVQLEYDWRPEGGFLPGTDAVHILPRAANYELAKVAYKDRIISTQGDQEHWTIVREMSSNLSGVKLIDEIGRIYAAAGKADTDQWSRSGAPVTPSGQPVSAWKVIDGDGKPWTVTISSDAVAGQSNKHLVRIGVARAG